MITENYFDEAIKKAVDNAFAQKNTVEAPKPQRKRINGIRGLGAFLECSTKTAQSLKNKCLFPVYNVGRKVYFYSDEVEAGIKKTA